MISEKPMTDAEIEHAEGLPATVECRGVLLRLVAEVRRLRAEPKAVIVPPAAPLMTSEMREMIERLQAEILQLHLQKDAKSRELYRKLAKSDDYKYAITVERDNLKKMLEDARAEIERLKRNTLCPEEGWTKTSFFLETCEELQRQRDEARRKLEDQKEQFEEAREIIAQVSYSPEFKKWFHFGVEQDPGGVHAFTAKHKPPEKPVPMCKDIRDTLAASDTAKGKLIDSDGTPGKLDALEDIMPPIDGTGGCC